MIQTVATAAASSLLAAVPFQLSFNLPFVQVQINGSEPLWFILDTGAQVMILDRTTAERIGVELEPLDAMAAGAGGETLELAVARNVDLGLGGFETRFELFYVTALGPVLSPHLGREVHGLLGYDFLSRFVIEIDYEEGIIRIHDPASYAYAGDGHVVRLDLINNHPHVGARIVRPGREDVDGDFVIDTGAAGPAFLSTSFVNAHGFLTDGGHTRPGFVAGIGGLSQQPVGRVSALSFGEVTIADPPVYFSQDSAGGFAGQLGADGIIGSEILRRYAAVWDYPQRRLILEPNAHIGEPFTHDVTDMTGFYLLAEGAGFDTIRVARVVPGGPADEAGIIEGDVIASIDGRSATEMAFEDVRRIFVHRGTHRIEIERGGAALEVVLESHDRWQAR